MVIFQDYFTFINEKRELKVNVVCRYEQNRQYVSLFCYFTFDFMCIFVLTCIFLYEHDFYFLIYCGILGFYFCDSINFPFFFTY